MYGKSYEAHKIKKYIKDIYEIKILIIYRFSFSINQ